MLPNNFNPLKKERADKLLVMKNLVPSRERAAAFILAGNVYLGQKKVFKPSELFPPDSDIHIKKPDHPYVGRGGVKLEKVLQRFDLNLNGKTAMDVGASTGGFTDCLLQHGVKKIYAVDCGTNQLDWKLRNNPNVVCLEKQNVRHLPFDLVGEKVDIITVDVSFISLRLIKSRLAEFIKPNGDVIMLVKPQFEAGKNKTDRGLVKEIEQREQIVADMIENFSDMFRVIASAESELPGKKKKNIEYFIHIKPLAIQC